MTANSSQDQYDKKIINTSKSMHSIVNFNEMLIYLSNYLMVVGCSCQVLLISTKHSL